MGVSAETGLGNTGGLSEMSTEHGDGNALGVLKQRIPEISFCSHIQHAGAKAKLDHFVAVSVSTSFAYLSAGAEAKRTQICEGGSAYLSCDLGFIKVIKANYGRTDHKTCASGKPANQLSNKHCFRKTSLYTMSNRCDGRKSCTVPAVNSVFSDPCVGTYKYLDVSYVCIPTKRSVTCEFSQSVIVCDIGTIFVHHANYGRRDLVTCPHKLATTPDCYSPQTSSLRSRCNGRKSCHVNASNSVFSDPCRGVHKYLEVSYSCK
ncbi:L-rhamnose-binding lectin CSL3-like [Rhinichthys klamathensis goyatoka]|uniref:L-rhamnose-binding lectin CSL3-like n=1 Tax=Rhinichthys klamathensis goyatoka TaxID=3034132 RepID=UPI0024B62184|nr:L-rhamnose-binding lectin CSL3-like [Rhinichthys klamathensis goyatoka]